MIYETGVLIGCSVCYQLVDSLGDFYLHHLIGLNNLLSFSINTMSDKRSRTTIVWPFFVYSKMAMFQAKK